MERDLTIDEAIEKFEGKSAVHEWKEHVRSVRNSLSYGNFRDLQKALEHIEELETKNRHLRGRIKRLERRVKVLRERDEKHKKEKDAELLRKASVNRAWFD